MGVRQEILKNQNLSKNFKLEPSELVCGDSNGCKNEDLLITQFFCYLGNSSVVKWRSRRVSLLALAKQCAWGQSEAGLLGRTCRMSVLSVLGIALYPVFGHSDFWGDPGFHGCDSRLNQWTNYVMRNLLFLFFNNTASPFGPFRSKHH